MSGKRQNHQLELAFHRNIYVRSLRAGQWVMESLTQFITQRLQLDVGQAEPKRRIAPKAVKRFQERVRQIARRRKGDSTGNASKT